MTNVAQRHSMTGGELLPTSDTLGDIWRVCQRVIGTGLLPDSIKSPEQAFAIALKGRELGIPQMMAFSGLYIIRGKVELTANMMSAMLRKGGVKIEEKEVSDEAAHLVFHRDEETAEVRFSLQDAKRAGLLNQTWQKYPRQMLYARALSEGSRRIGPDLIPGAYVTGEVSGEVLGVGEAPAIEMPSEKAPKPVEAVVAPEPEAPAEAPEEPAEAKETPVQAKASEPQVKKLVVLCNKLGLPDHEVHAMLLGQYGVSSRKDLTKRQATALIKSLELLEKEGPESPRWDKIITAIQQGEKKNNAVG